MAGPDASQALDALAARPVTSTRGRHLQRTTRDSLARIKRAARRCTELETFVELGELYGWMIHANPVGVYADDQLVRLCARRFFAVFAAPAEPRADVTLHVISDARAHGGHTRLMERLASFEIARPELLITRSSHTEYAASMKHVFSKVTHANRAFEAGDLGALAWHCASFRRVVAHTSEFDFPTAVALEVARRASGTFVFFVNHADHHFSFGREQADCLLQISLIGSNASRQHAPAARSSFVGIPLDGSPADLREPISARPLRVLATGAAWKFQPLCGLSLVPMLHQFLSAVPDASLMVVGVRPLRDPWWWPLKLRHWRRVALKPNLPYAEYLRCTAESSIILDSFPISGGTAFAESLWRGAWVFALHSPLGGASPTDMLRQDTLAALGPELLTSPHYRERLQACAGQLPSVHGPEAVKDRYRAALGGAQIEPPASLRPATRPNILTEAWIDRGRVTLPREVFGFRTPSSRRQLMGVGLRQFGALTMISRLRLLRAMLLLPIQLLRTGVDRQ